MARRWIEGRDLTDGFGPPPDPLRHGYVVTGERVGSGSHLLTLCDRHVEATPSTPGRPAPECPACDRVWRAAEGIEQRDQHPLPGRRPAQKRL